MKAKDLLAVLMREPLGYTIARQNGSHRKLTAPGRPPLTFSFHDRVTIPPGLIRTIMVKQAGLDADEAMDILRG
jgi:predicted RNA binding protein YcfA (HicA-like mRNA interferase family)